ncbi:MAG: caspase family protein [Myxococcaceae bacterium]
MMVVTTLVAALLCAGVEGPARQRFAVVVGANDGTGQRRLVHATTDARAFLSVMQLLGGVNPGDESFLENPSSAELIYALTRVGDRVTKARATGRRAELVFYYSGHADQHGLVLRDGALEYARLREKLQSAPADFRIAVLDSCSSGSFARAKGGTKVAPFLVDHSSDVTGDAVLTSSSAAELSQESDHLGGSFFTRSLLAGLRGGADLSGDGRVTLHEAYRFAFDQTLAQTQSTALGPQHPSYEMAVSGRGEVVLTDLRGTAAVLALPPTMEGRVFVRDGQGNLVVEVNKRPGLPLELGMEEGEYRVTQVRPASVRETTVRLVRDQRVSIDDSALKAVDPAKHAARGEAAVVAAEPATAPVPRSWQFRLQGGAAVLTRQEVCLLANLAGGLYGGCDPGPDHAIAVGAELMMPLNRWLAVGVAGRFSQAAESANANWLEPRVALVFTPVGEGRPLQPRLSVGAGLFFTTNNGTGLGADVSAGAGLSYQWGPSFGIAADVRLAYGIVLSTPFTHVEAVLGPEFRF